MNPTNCKKCNGKMIPSRAIRQTLVPGAPDFLGDREGNIVTMSPGGPGKLINCWKCKECGWSVTG